VCPLCEGKGAKDVKLDIGEAKTEGRRVDGHKNVKVLRYVRRNTDGGVSPREFDLRFVPAVPPQLHEVPAVSDKSPQDLEMAANEEEMDMMAGAPHRRRGKQTANQKLERCGPCGAKVVRNQDNTPRRIRGAPGKIGGNRGN
jgi:hypothetical protein